MASKSSMFLSQTCTLSRRDLSVPARASMSSTFANASRVCCAMSAALVSATCPARKTRSPNTEARLRRAFWSMRVISDMGCPYFLLAGGDDAAAVIERGADQIVARLRRAERRMRRQRHVRQLCQGMTGRQRLDGEDVEAGMRNVARAQRLKHRVLV